MPLAAGSALGAFKAMFRFRGREKQAMGYGGHIGIHMVLGSGAYSARILERESIEPCKMNWTLD